MMVDCPVNAYEVRHVLPYYHEVTTNVRPGAMALRADAVGHRRAFNPRVGQTADGRPGIEEAVATDRVDLFR
jgi:hypothetical protein